MIARMWREAGDLPAPVRHFILVTLVAFITWSGGDDTSFSALRMLISAAALAVLTPLIQSYGLGITSQNKAA